MICRPIAMLPHKKGFILPLNLSLYGLIGAVVLAGGLGIAYKLKSGSYDRLQASYEAFKAKVASEGKLAEERYKAELARQERVAHERYAALQKSHSDIESRYRRLRDNPSSGPVPPLSSAAPGLSACAPNDSDAVARRLAQLETGILELSEWGDKEIAKYVELWTWAQAISAPR